MTNVEPVEPPDFDELVAELALIRRSGITRLRALHLPALGQATRAAGLDRPGRPVEPPQIERLLRDGLSELGGGRLGETTGLLFGLAPGAKATMPSTLRVQAAECWGIGLSQFAIAGSR